MAMGVSLRDCPSTKFGTLLLAYREMLRLAEDLAVLAIISSKNKVLFLFLFANGKVKSRRGN
jgi:hypothetical protein